MRTVTESVPQWIGPDLNEAFPRTTSKPELGEIVVFTEVIRQAFWSSPV
jgi:hypothetical protein